MYAWIIVVVVIILILVLIAAAAGGFGAVSNTNSDSKSKDVCDWKKYHERKKAVLTFYVDDVHELIAFEATKRFLELEPNEEEEGCGKRRLCCRKTKCFKGCKDKSGRRKVGKDCKFSKGHKFHHEHITLVRVSGNNYHFNGKVLTFEDPTSYYDHMYDLGYTIFGGYTSTVVIEPIKQWAKDKSDVKIITLGSATDQLDENSQYYRLYPPYSQSKIWLPISRFEDLTVLYEPSQIVSQLLAQIELAVPNVNAVDVSDMTPEEAAQQVCPESNVLLLTGREKLAAEYPDAFYYAMDFFNWLPLEFNHQIQALQARIVGDQVFFTEYQINYVNQVHSLVAIAELLSKCTPDEEIQPLFNLDCFNDRLALETEEQVFLPEIGWLPSYLVGDLPLREYLETVDVNIRQAAITYIQFLRAVRDSPCEYELFWNPKLLEELEELFIPDGLLVSPAVNKCFWNR